MPAVQKVNPGQTIKYPASFYNAQVDLVNALGRGGAGNPLRSLVTSTIVSVKNSSSDNVDQYGILGIDSAFIDTTNLDLFKSKIVLNGVTPTTDHVGKFIVLLFPLAAGEVGLGVLSGATQVKVDFPSGTETFADAKSGSNSELKAGASGAKILYREGGTAAGTWWTIVNIGAGAASSSVEIVTLTLNSGGAGDDTTECSYTYDFNYQGTPYTNVSMTGGGQRMPLGEMSVGTVGLAASGGVLYWANEHPTVLECADDQTPAFGF